MNRLLGLDFFIKSPKNNCKKYYKILCFLIFPLIKNPVGIIKWEWFPACAGMTCGLSLQKWLKPMDSRLRGNDRERKSSLIGLKS